MKYTHDEVQKKLEQCSHKIGLWGDMTLDSLIEAYLSVRESNIQYMNEIHHLRKKGYDQGYAAGLEQAMSREFIKIDDLREMTMAEVAALLDGGE